MMLRLRRESIPSTNKGIDKTTKLTEANTVLSQDTSVLTESGNAKAASQTDHYQHLLINSRREANQLFEIALGKLSPENQTNAIRAMNLVEEQIFKATLNKRESTFIGSPEYLKNSVAEQNVSDAKKLLAAQINDGTFLRNLSAYANNGMQAQCVHQDADVVDYDHR